MFRCGMDGVISKLVFSALICHLAIVLHCSNAVSGFFVLVGVVWLLWGREMRCARKGIGRTRIQRGKEREKAVGEGKDRGESNEKRRGERKRKRWRGGVRGREKETEVERQGE